MTTKITLLAALLSIAVLAQEQNPQFHVHTKENKISSKEAIQAFEAPIVSSYTLESGDELTVEVWGHTELSGITFSDRTGGSRYPSQES